MSAMRTRLALATALVGVVVAFVYFVPISYVAAVPVLNCINLDCPPVGHSAYYISISYRMFGQGAVYWLGTRTYELIGTPFGSYDFSLTF
jgi:hypothetical protein